MHAPSRNAASKVDYGRRWAAKEALIKDVGDLGGVATGNSRWVKCNERCD